MAFTLGDAGLEYGNATTRLAISLAGVDLVTVKELLDHKTINMTNRYTHLAQEHKAQAVAKLEDRYKAGENETQSQSAIVSTELKEAINADLTPKLEQNRNIFLVRRGRGLGIVNDFKVEGGERIRTAASRFCRPLP